MNILLIPYVDTNIGDDLMIDLFVKRFSKCKIYILGGYEQKYLKNYKRLQYLNQLYQFFLCLL